MISPALTSERIGKTTRFLLVAFALILVGILGVASRLEPDPKGFGTHTQLGLLPCAFRVAMGRPCPTCGMTTSFAWFVRANLVQSWRANPSGSLIAATSLVLIPWLLVVAVWGRPWPFRYLEQPLVGLSVAVVALTLISWSVQMIMGGR
jgi:hypothetical protein